MRMKGDDNPQLVPSDDDSENIFTTGIGTQWPDCRLRAEEFEEYVLRWHDRSNPV